MLLRINAEITATIVGLWDDQRQWRGHLPLANALALADMASLDLIEFAPKTEPPTCLIGDNNDYQAHGLARDLSDAGFEANPEMLSLIARYEDKGVRSGEYLLLLTPMDALRFAEEAAACGVGALGPNFWYGPGWEWYPSPDYSALAREPDFVQQSLIRLREDVEQHLPEDVAFVEIVLHDPVRPRR
jgi:Translation initiation factor IF-3, N-terminal domain